MLYQSINYVKGAEQIQLENYMKHFSLKVLQRNYMLLSKY